jgi:pimeloyl-ACP methyl ester carboxylesterase
MPWWGPEGWDFAEYAPAEDFAARLPEIPVFLYHSVDDPHVPVDHLKLYEAQLRDARVRRVPGADHSFLRGLPDLVEDIQGCESTIDKRDAEA